MSIPIKAYLGTTPLFNTGKSSDNFVRPADWLTLPAAPSDGVKALHAIFDSPSNFCSIRCQNAFTVDWGDGSAPQNFSANSTAHYNYNWNNVSSATLTSAGYRQVIVTVTPQAGNILTLIHLAEKHNQAGLTNSYSTGWLDINVNAPNLISGSSRLFFGTGIVRSSLLKRIYIGNWGNLTSLQSIFARCRDLESLNETEWNTSSVTNFFNAFWGCESLKSLDCRNWNTSAATNFGEMFRTCTSLIRIEGLENFNTSNVTNFVTMFGSSPVLFGHLAELNLNNWNTAKATSLAGMFTTNTSLRRLKVNQWNTGLVTNLDNFVNGSSALINLDLSNWNLSACTTATNVFQNCFSIREINLPSLSATTNLGSNFTSSTNSLAKFSFPSGGINASINLTSCSFNAETLNTIYTNLSATGTGKTITVVGNYGAAESNISIATAKGWTVTR
jgi:surface protein